MKISFVVTLALASIVHVLPKEEAQLDAATILAQDAAKACGAAGTCHGLDSSGEFCNDRCKTCSDDNGSRYTHGECCGFLPQACCCLH